MSSIKLSEAIERAAHAAHSVNRTYCQALGDKSQPMWHDAPEWQRASARMGAAAIATNPSTTPEQSHKGWLKQKQDDGWKYGYVKDAAKKEHPCMVPYAELPVEQRMKDTIFGAVVRGILDQEGVL